jgi:hypothetical protein
MNFSIKLPDYIPTWLKIIMVCFLVFCVAGVPFWIFVVDEVHEIIAMSIEQNPSESPDSIRINPVRSLATGVIEETTETAKAVSTIQP